MTRIDISDEHETKGDPHNPITSDHPIPLFPDYNKDNRHFVKHINVHKLSAPGDGYKGEVAPTTTLYQIGRMFGNGLYDFHAVSGEGKVLRRNTNVKIDLPPPEQSPIQRAPSPMRDHELTLLTFQRDQHEKDAERVATFARESTEQNKQMTEKHLAMVEKTMLSQAERDREFFAAQALQQREFFANLLAFTQQSHQQTMALMQASYDRMMALQDPTTMIALFQQGLQVGQGLHPDDDNPLAAVLDRGVQGLEKVRQLMVLKNASALRTLPKGATPVAGPTSGQKTLNLPPESLSKIAKIKQKVEAKGFRWDDALAQIEALVDGTPHAASDESESDEEEAEGNGSDGAGGNQGEARGA
jgi:hypothetical protein